MRFSLFMEIQYTIIIIFKYSNPLNYNCNWLLAIPDCLLVKEIPISTKRLQLLYKSFEPYIDRTFLFYL